MEAVAPAAEDSDTSAHHSATVLSPGVVPSVYNPTQSPDTKVVL